MTFRPVISLLMGVALFCGLNTLAVACKCDSKHHACDSATWCCGNDSTTGGMGCEA